MVSIDDMLEAYYDCRKKKRRTASAVVYEMNYESNLLALCNRINTRIYTPGKSICFVVTRPRHREVFAASFEDRIVHHYIGLRMEPLFEQVFNPRTFNCRKGKGQLYGVNMLRNDILECSNNYTDSCWIMKLDLKGFFMSIDKKILADMIEQFIMQHYKGEDKDDLLYLCKVVISHEPENNCERHSPLSYWDSLPANKSLFTNGQGKGVAIGNLFAQLFANFLLNGLDWYLEEIGIKYHGRYVDDFYCVSSNKRLLLSSIPLIRNKLDDLGLQLNEKKFYLQHCTKGVEFTGTIIKPGRTYCSNRTITNMRASVIRLNRATNEYQATKAVNSINSYLGILRRNNEYGMRCKILRMISHEAFRWVYIKGHYDVLAMKNKYKPIYRIKKELSNGNRRADRITH